MNGRSAPQLKIGDEPAAARLRRLGGGESELVAAIVDGKLGARDRVGAAHRLSGRLAACSTRGEAVSMVRRLRSAALWDAICDLLMQGDALGALVVQLIQWLTLDAEGCRDLDRSGALAVLVGVLRAPDGTLRGHGLPVIATVAELHDLGPSLSRAGVLGLLHSLSGLRDPNTWHWILAISEGLLRDPRSLPLQSRQALASVLLRCPLNRTDGHCGPSADALATSDSMILRRILAELRLTTKVRQSGALQAAARPQAAGRPAGLYGTGAAARAEDEAVQPKKVGMSMSLARATAAANAVAKGGSMTAATTLQGPLSQEQRDRAWALEEDVRNLAAPAGITVVGPGWAPAPGPGGTPRAAW